MTIQEYFAEAGSRFTDTDAQVIGPELCRLAEAGKATTSGIVEAARDRSSPLHPYFEWDDERAADAYRKVQARELVRAIKVRVVGEDGERRELLAVRAARMRAATVKVAVAESTQSRVSWHRPPTPAEQIRAEIRRELKRVVDRFGRYPKLMPELADEFGPTLKLLTRAADGLPIENPEPVPATNTHEGVRVVEGEGGRW